MSAAHNTVPGIKGLSTLVRPRFGPGMLLQHEDLEQLHGYTRELNRLMFRSLFGCGVICGLVVKTGEKCGQLSITVGAGLALNCSGDPIHVPKDQTVVVDPHCDPNLEGPFWVVLCPTVRCCAPRTSMCPSDDEDTSTSCTRERDGFEIRVVKDRPGCACDCVDDPAREVDGDGGSSGRDDHDSECWCVDPQDPCYADHYQGKCGCACDGCSGGGCDCVLLARLARTEGDPPAWQADHSVRRFIRPVLMRDPQVAAEIEERKEAQQAAAAVPVVAAYTADRTDQPAGKARAKSTKAGKVQS